MGDADGVANGIIVDPSGLAVDLSGSSPGDISGGGSGGGDDDGSSGGSNSSFFISTAANESPTAPHF